MKLPNGYGSISKLSGNRRKPWVVRVTLGWTQDPDDGKISQQRKIIGCYETQSKARQALAAYHENPYNIAPDITFSEVYDKWSREKFDTISHSNENGYKASYAVCGDLYQMRFVDIRKSHLQGVVDTCGKNYPSLRKLKVLFSQLYRYALENDICQKDYSDFVDIVKHKEKGKVEKHKPFLESEIETLWGNKNRNDYISTVLMLLYSGVRVSELLDLKKENVHLDKQYFDVIESKTEAGIRKVPIAEKILPFFEFWIKKSPCPFLLCTLDGKKISYHNYREIYWVPLMKELEMDHLPHDTRHTTISMLAKAEVNQTIIKRIVGHAGAMNLTERVYTHHDIQQLIDAINKI